MDTYWVYLASDHGSIGAAERAARIMYRTSGRVAVMARIYDEVHGHGWEVWTTGGSAATKSLVLRVMRDGTTVRHESASVVVAIEERWAA
jgi:hypothetical protein